MKYTWKTKSQAREKGGLKTVAASISNTRQTPTWPHDIPAYTGWSVGSSIIVPPCLIPSQSTVLSFVSFGWTFARHSAATITVARVSFHAWAGRISHPFQNPSSSPLYRGAGVGKWICEYFPGSAGKQSSSHYVRAWAIPTCFSLSKTCNRGKRPRKSVQVSEISFFLKWWIRMFHEINGKRILERIKRGLDKLKILSETKLE